MKHRFFIAVVVVGLLSLPIAGTVSAKGEKSDQKELYKNLDLFAKVLHNIQNDYVEPVKEKELVYGAIEGMLASLDPHSLFMPPDLYKELRIDTEGQFGGNGIEIAVKDGLLTVVAPLEGTPAARAGIKAGDQILRINDHSSRGMSLSDTVKMMRGKKGTSVKLTLKRKGMKAFTVTLKRDKIRIASVKQELIEGRYGYLRIVSFQEGTARDLRAAIGKLERLSDKKMAGLILDLRNNPGGLLDEAVQVADTFLAEGVIVMTESRNKQRDEKTAQKEGTISPLPLIVIINGGSASAAEIVAGALQDHHRAVLLGARTFGKGTVQTVYELGDGSALKLTIAKYYTPSGRSIQAEGIAPDIWVETREQASVALKESSSKPSETAVEIREKDLKGHFEPENGAATESEPDTVRSTGDDFQKEAAVNTLKSWKVFQNLSGGEGVVLR